MIIYIMLRDDQSGNSQEEACSKDSVEYKVEWPISKVLRHYRRPRQKY